MQALNPMASDIGKLSFNLHQLSCFLALLSSNNLSTYLRVIKNTFGHAYSWTRQNSSSVDMWIFVF